MGAVKTDVDTVNLHRPTRVSGGRLSMSMVRHAGHGGRGGGRMARQHKHQHQGGAQLPQGRGVLHRDDTLNLGIFFILGRCWMHEPG